MPFDSEIPARSRDLIVLEKARERIARGWCQNHAHGENGAVCIIGALGLTLPNVSNLNPWTDMMGFGPTPDTSAARWNDAPGRTQAEVLERFDAAIAKLEKNYGE